MTPSLKALITLVLLGVHGAVAPSPPDGRTSYLIGRGQVEELRRVVGDQVRQRYPLGLSTVFGVSASLDSLATIAQRNEAGRGAQHLTVFDLKTGSILTERTVEPRLMTWMSGPERVL